VAALGRGELVRFAKRLALENLIFINGFQLLFQWGFKPQHCVDKTVSLINQRFSKWRDKSRGNPAK
jgi:hypothetical protein